MLGRQQIAGIPTAISELFKNAHDAYASEATANFVLPEHLFNLRDDGRGMTLEEFESGWLTLGTESKLLPRQRPPLAGMQPRALLGEKGIGRLAVSVIGPQMLILTRALDRDRRQPLVMSFVHWGIFEIPGVDLEEIDIPIEVARGAALPDSDQVHRLIDKFSENLLLVRSRASGEVMSRIEEDLRRFDVDPSSDDSRLPGPRLGEGASGTHFYIKPTDESVAVLVADPAGDEGSPLQRMLIGFTNTMTTKDAAVPLTTHFYYHRSLDDVEDVIADREFFSPEDFDRADHAIWGSFDEFGQFNGSIRIYDSDPVVHRVAWPRARGIPTSCGPFNLTVAYVQGAVRQSRLTPEDHARMGQKLSRAAGLYVYRDGVRILPYGNSEYDFLDIEERRTKSAAYYFFSYRRMFGAIELTSQTNANLQEKAGREGFRENAAYRQFRQILENFFIQTAADHFREKGSQSEDFLAQREDLERQDQARQRRERTISARRNAFRTRLDETLRRIDAGEPAVDAATAKALFLDGAALARSQSDSTAAVERLIHAESVARAKLNEIREKYKVTRPRGVGLGRELTRDWHAYVEAQHELDVSFFPQVEDELDSLVEESAAELGSALDARRRLEKSIEETSARSRSEVGRASRSIREKLQRLTDEVLQTARSAVAEMDATITAVQSDMASSGVANNRDVDVSALRSSLEEAIRHAAETHVLHLQRVAERLEAATAGDDALEVDEIDVAAALDEELLALRERADIDLELSALGMAVEVMNHEFDASVRAVGSYLRRLGVWAERNPALRTVYEGLSASFDHLHGYLSLFTPLQRRVHRRKLEIKGSDISAFLADLFRTRLLENDVALEVEQEFRDQVLIGYPSTFYPVFVNLIDNAMYWLQDADKPRVISLRVDGDDLVVADNGPGIKDRDRSAIFELGFTRKPGGRGLGLHISRELLLKAGWDLIAERPHSGGAAFRLHPRDDESA